MNHTMITAAIVTILATLVAGSGAFTTTAQSADAYNKNDHNGKIFSFVGSEYNACC
jgi:hypothetical protein